jgi:hypothetical protein
VQRQKNRTSAAKADQLASLYGTAEQTAEKIGFSRRSGGMQGLKPIIYQAFSARLKGVP